MPQVTTRRAAPQRRAPSPPQLEIAEDVDGGVRTLALSGELDLSTAVSLCARMDAARRAGSRPRVLIDLSGLTFSDSTGLRVLVGAAQEIRASAGRLGLVVPDGSPVARLLEVSGMREHLPVYRSAGEALRALGRPAAT
jgi:anti-anti-sigma factor